jgi:N-acyl-D-aspartate/D-glutamate deacylase
MTADLVIRNGTVVDGTGGAVRRADVAIEDGVITDVGDGIGRGRRELDADGLMVTPGFVDPHTHYDGQATWDAVLAPSAHHGVTTVAMGNCGVGFAPVAPDRHDWLIEMMEGVEDIPGTALHEGLRWDWESFPQYLDALDRQPRTIDVGTHVPHAALRAFVMGERGADPAEHPDVGELDDMAALLGEGLDAGAIGVSTSRTERHRTSRGENLGTLHAREPELMALASVLAERDCGVFQFLSDSYRTTDDEFARSEFELVAAFARASRRPVSYTVQQDTAAPERWRDLMALAGTLQAEGLDVKAQVAPRPIGVLLGLQASVNVFTPSRAYSKIAGLPISERVEALRDPERRRRIIDGHAHLTSGPDAFAGYAFFGRFDDMYVLDDPVDYNLDSSRSLAAVARRAGVDPREYAYDVQLQRNGDQLIYTPMFNFAHGNLDAVHEMITSPVAMFGLSDAGAHCGQICDGSMTTTYVSLWARDRREQDGLPVEAVVHQITQRPAAHFGWLDRGVVAPGYLADLNVIDLARLGCAPPEITADLPAGGRRLLQAARGYRWTLKRGTVTFEEGVHTGELPGALVRGTRSLPVRTGG